MSINLKMSEATRKLNSCLVVAPRGSGKSELLEHLLAASNPKHFVVLPPKIFESELETKGRDFFHNKIMIADDLIVSFEGMSTKQRQQLENFWTKLLEGGYAREAHSIMNVSTIALFGLASEQLDRFRDELMSSTFLDRVPPFKHDVSTDMKRKILQLRSRKSMKSSTLRGPVIKLPLPEKIEDGRKANVAFPHTKEMENRIVEYAMELDNYAVQCSARSINRDVMR
jgi:energy-coupling factor transporter ATP-binding protein EcfA2